MPPLIALAVLRELLVILCPETPLHPAYVTVADALTALPRIPLLTSNKTAAMATAPPATEPTATPTLPPDVKVWPPEEQAVQAAVIIDLTHVGSLVVRGVLTCRKSELLCNAQPVAVQFFPGEWANFLTLLPESERGGPMGAYYGHITSNDPAVSTPAARHWNHWEFSIAKPQTPSYRPQEIRRPRMEPHACPI
jgi:hypothetical protein